MPGISEYLRERSEKFTCYALFFRKDFLTIRHANRSGDIRFVVNLQDVRKVSTFTLKGCDAPDNNSTGTGYAGR